MIKKGFSYIGVFFLSFLSLFPTALLYVLADLSYYVVYYVIGYRKQIVRENLERSFPEKSLEERLKIEKQFFRFFADLTFETIKMHSISRSELERRFKFKNLEQIEGYFESGESILACTGHYGNWEWGMMALGLHLSEKCYVIYKPLNNKVFDNWFHTMRTKFGNVFVPMRQTLRVLSSVRKEPTMFCFASDQSPVKGESRYWMNFLNQPTAALLGLEKIAVQTDRPIFYFKLKVIKRGYYEVECVPIVLHPKKTGTHEITDTHFQFLASIIKEDPAYWLWSHRRWKNKPDNEEWQNQVLQ